LQTGAAGILLDSRSAIQVFIFPVVILKAAWETRFSSQDCVVRSAVKLKAHDKGARNSLKRYEKTLWK